MDDDTAKVATPHHRLIRELLDPSVPKSEREHAAVYHIEMLASMNAAPTERLVQEINRLKEAGCELADAAARVVRTYDGVHRLSMALGEWFVALAGPKPDEPTLHIFKDRDDDPESLPNAFQRVIAEIHRQGDDDEMTLGQALYHLHAEAAKKVRKGNAE